MDQHFLQEIFILGKDAHQGDESTPVYGVRVPLRDTSRVEASTAVKSTAGSLHKGMAATEEKGIHRAHHHLVRHVFPTFS